MIDLQIYERILKSGLLLDHYMTLCRVRDSLELSKSKRVQGFLNLLNKKGYIEDGILTEVGLKLTDDRTEATLVDSVPVETTDFMTWVFGLHKKCQDKLLALMGCKQVKDKIQGSGKYYPFLCNATDMSKVLHRAITVYKLDDMDKIERCLLGHIDKCYKAKSWFPLMKYYIIKGGVRDSSSDMVTDLEGIDDVQENEGKSLQKFV